MNDLAGRIIGHYERHAADWDADRRRSGWNDKVWHDRFVASLQRGARVLDLGCGGGSPVATNLVAQGLRVTGVDSSPTLIALCRERLPDETWIVADMRDLSLAERFDGFLAWDSFFHLKHDDQRAMFAVFAARAAPGAILMFNSGPAFGEAIGSYRGDPLYHASLDPAEYRQLLAQHSFDLVEHVADDPLAGGRTGWLARATSR
jgi:trans-aconitate methyltransferase